MKLEDFLNKFEEKFTTIDVFEGSKNNFIIYNTFDVVPVRCDIKYLWDGDIREVEDTFCVDKISLGTDDNMVSFELAERTKEMISVDDIISLNVSKISEREYLQAIKDDEDELRFLKFLS